MLGVIVFLKFVRILGFVPIYKMFAVDIERENPEKHQTKQANEDDEQEDWAQKETFSFMSVKDGTEVTKCSWKMNLVSDCVVNS